LGAEKSAPFSFVQIKKGGISMKPLFDVEIKETLRMTVRVDADNAEQAEAIVRAEYDNCDYILDAEHFDGVEFNTRKVNARNKSDRYREEER
jgi:hypothetical protein